ncbi:PEGA domain-containing protein [Pseudomonas sp. NPDC098747]|uniref:PEGA domain-containing protein n=1 Tax=Pseudomonas sp. NPDC098747 TaxID=3364487 RepID=UPI00383BD016
MENTRSISLTTNKNPTISCLTPKKLLALSGAVLLLPLYSFAGGEPPIVAAGSTAAEKNAQPQQAIAQPPRATPEPTAALASAQATPVSLPTQRALAEQNTATTSTDRSETSQGGGLPTTAPTKISPDSPPSLQTSTPPAASTAKTSSPIAPSTARETAPANNSAPSKINVVPTQAPTPVVQPSTESNIGNIREALRAKQKELLELEERATKAAEGLASLELDLNEAKTLEARLKQTIVLETENFLQGKTTVNGLDQIRAEYVTQNDQRESLQNQYIKMKKIFDVATKKSNSLKVSIAETETSLTRLENARDKLAIAETRKSFPKEMTFVENLSFKCSTAKGLSYCLEEKNITSLVQENIAHHYSMALRKNPNAFRKVPPFSENDLSYSFNHSFKNAQMDMNGFVSATVQINATLHPKSSLACTILDINPQLCTNALYTLTVRSNKHDDVVSIDGAKYGHTPLVLALPKGYHSIQVNSQKMEQTKKILLDNDKVINFKFKI